MLYKIDSPLRVPAGKKDFVLNLNKYRNTHYYDLNKAKIAYCLIIREQIRSLPTFNNCLSITYTLYPKTKHLCDLDNVLSIHAKFFQDSLVAGGKIPDDNYNFINHCQFEFGGIDKENPRVEIGILAQ